jgi:hypothetical protein
LLKKKKNIEERRKEKSEALYGVNSQRARPIALLAALPRPIMCWTMYQSSPTDKFHAHSGSLRVRDPSMPAGTSSRLAHHPLAIVTHYSDSTVEIERQSIPVRHLMGAVGLL